MTTDTKVDDTPQVSGKGDADPTETAGIDIDVNALTGLFGEGDNAEEESLDSSVQEDEKPASNSDEEASPEEEEESSLKVEDEATDSEEEVEEQEEKSPEEDEPKRFRKRIDKLTAQYKESQERVEALEKKLEESEESQRPPETDVNRIENPERLDELEKQAQEAEDAFQDLLDQGPKYAEDDYDKEKPYYEVGDQQWSREEVISGRNRAREAYREIPKRRVMIQQVQAINTKIDEKYSFFHDKEDPNYDLAKKTIADPIYKDVASRHAGAKQIFAWAIKGKLAEDAETEKENKQAKPAKPTKIPSTPTSKAVTDTGTAAVQRTEAETKTKENRKLIKTGSVSKDQLMNMF